MNHKEELSVVLDATNVCNRNCSICECNSKIGKPVHFTAKMLDKLLKEMIKFRFGTTFIVAGGGEPLLNPHVPYLARTISEFPLTNWLFLITSGFMDKVERNRLKQVIDNTDDEKLMICLSYHGFSETAKTRFKKTLEFLLDMDVTNIRIYVTLAADTKNIFKTINNIERIFQELRICEFLVYPDQSELTQNIFCNQIYSGKKDDLLTSLSCLDHTWYYLRKFYFFPEEPEKWICICPQYLFARGKAINLRDPLPWHTMRCELIMSSKNNIGLRVDSSGNYYPHYSCNPAMYPDMVIGNLNNSMESILEKRELIGKNIMKNIIANRSLICQEDYCSLCSKIKAELDAYA
jgi:MoaA/NifB/PqqE/SkfB family radical SAM enzyme